MRLQLDCGKGHIIETDLPAFIMGIVNTTPDSFYEPSRSTSLEKSLIRALALIDDPALGTLIAEEAGAVVLMHKRGTPPTMQQNVPQYRNVVTEVRDYLEARVAHALNCGIAHKRIIIDYGIGFGKTAEDNYRLIAASAYFTGLGYPLLVGLSRKSFIGYVTGEPPEKRLAGTLAATMYAVQQGASIVRAHDVAETRELLLVLKELQKYGTT